MHVRDRVTFFESSLRLRLLHKMKRLIAPLLTAELRRRQRHQWVDTPLIRVLSPSADLEHTRAVAKVRPPLPVQAREQNDFSPVSKVKKVAQAIIQHGLAQGCHLGASFLSLNKAPPEDPAIEPQQFTSLLASYKLKGVTKVCFFIKTSLFSVHTLTHSLQADLSVVATYFRDARSGMVHLAAVKTEFQLDIKPLPILNKMVRVLPFLFRLLFGVVSFRKKSSFLILLSVQGCGQLDVQRLHICFQFKVCRACTLKTLLQCATLFELKRCLAGQSCAATFATSARIPIRPLAALSVVLVA